MDDQQALARDVAFVQAKAAAKAAAKQTAPIPMANIPAPAVVRDDAVPADIVLGSDLDCAAAYVLENTDPGWMMVNIEGSPMELAEVYERGRTVPIKLREYQGVFTPRMVLTPRHP